MSRIFSYYEAVAVVGLAAVTLFGLASTLLADPVEEAKELVTAYYEATRLEDWDTLYLQFDVDAEISITTDYGYGDPAVTVSFLASEWNSLPEPELSAQQITLLADYTELSRTVEIVEAKETEDGVMVRAIQSVRYQTSDYEGTATEADNFLVSRSFGQPLVRGFNSTHTFQ
jgi:hypothetical protein